MSKSHARKPFDPVRQARLEKRNRPQRGGVRGEHRTQAKRSENRGRGGVSADLCRTVRPPQVSRGDVVLARAAGGKLRPAVITRTPRRGVVEALPVLPGPRKANPTLYALTDVTAAGTHRRGSVVLTPTTYAIEDVCRVLGRLSRGDWTALSEALLTYAVEVAVDQILHPAA